MRREPRRGWKTSIARVVFFYLVSSELEVAVNLVHRTPFPLLSLPFLPLASPIPLSCRGAVAVAAVEVVVDLEGVAGEDLALATSHRWG